MHRRHTNAEKNCFRALKPAAIGFYFLLLVIGSVISAWETFYGVFLIEDLNVSDKWFGKYSYMKSIFSSQKKNLNISL